MALPHEDCRRSETEICEALLRAAQRPAMDEEYASSGLPRMAAQGHKRSRIAKRVDRAGRRTREGSREHHTNMKIATWNVNSLRVRLPQVLRWLDTHRPDVLALQETKTEDRNFPVAEFEAAGYSAAFCGQPTYNGVALLSRLPMEVFATALPDFDDPQKRVLLARVGALAVLNLYVPNGQSIESDKFRYKLEWLAQLNLWVKALLDKYPQLVILGDFNIAPEDRDVHDPQAWVGQVLVSEPERTAFRQLLKHGLRDSFRLHQDGGGFYSWWDYRAAGFSRNQGMRIDHILLSPALAEGSLATVIDREPRGWERPSDHVPVITSL